jgi:outer membrane protein assembly factor BamB
MTNAPEGRVRLRLWPGVALVSIGWFLWLFGKYLFPERGMYTVIGGLACGALVYVWWLLFSRAPLVERIGGIGLIAAGMAVTRLTLLHPSVARGAQGFLFFLYAIHVFAMVLVLWAVATQRMSSRSRRMALIATVVLACVGFALLRTDGITGEGHSQFAWRWSKTAEERLLEERGAAPAAVPPPAAAQTKPVPEVPATEPVAEPKLAPPRSTDAPPTVPPTPVRAEWPGFRGPNRDSVVTGTRISTDWNAARPVELWRRPVGPGWSSFAVAGDRLYTQEQRGDFELVSCYNARTGESIWTHQDAARFWESNGGPGPRGTPSLHNGRVYTMGATGIVNALDALTGKVAWKRNAAEDTGAKLPGWGFTSSPLVVGDVLVVAASGSVAGYDLATGKLRWTAPKAGGSYSSPHLVALDGVPQVVLLSSVGATGLAPTDGKVLWQHAWPGYPIVQPSVTPHGALLITTGDAAGGLGMRRLKVAKNSDTWTAEELWTSRGLKPYFNDSVLHNGHAYGFDGSILSCIDLRDGTRKWKGGRYGHGQMLLLRDQDLLLVLSEAGELVLVAARPDEFTEIAKMTAIEGKTWNHPVLVGNILYVRNGEEMAAFRLAPGVS